MENEHRFRMSGARFIAETLKGYGITHIFWVEAILRRTLVEMEDLGIRRVLAHSEKAAAYMADGYARASGRPSVCMAQSVGAANLASGLQDAFLGNSPVIALTGFKPPLAQYRHAYQEILHHSMFDSTIALATLKTYFKDVAEVGHSPYLAATVNWQSIFTAYK